MTKRRRGDQDSLDGMVWPVSSDGVPQCDPPDDCAVCVLFTEQRPYETPAGWLTRIRDAAYRLSGTRAPDVVVPERADGYGNPAVGEHQSCANPDCTTPWARYSARGLCTNCISSKRAGRIEIPDAVASVGVGLLTGIVLALAALGGWWP